MAGLFDDQELTIKCQRCGHMEKKTIGWIRNNNQFRCICGAILTLKTDEFNRQLAETEASYDRLKKTLRENSQRSQGY